MINKKNQEVMENDVEFRNLKPKIRRLSSMLLSEQNRVDNAVLRAYMLNQAVKEMVASFNKLMADATKTMVSADNDT
ncbi:MAG: hypothetical protein SVZ03_08065 [Spirochaetota bacterium]|nr:hypothetical protein [Spirochaetota bacterium]